MPGIGPSAVEQVGRLLGEILARGENDVDNPLKNVDKMLPWGSKLGTRLEGFEPTTLGSEDRCSIR